MEDSPCKGCEKRELGCRGGCVELLVHRVLEQPEKERMEKQKRKAVLMASDKISRINAFHPLNTTDKSPYKCHKK